MSTLVLNMGLKSIRCVIFNTKGERLAFDSLPLHTTICGDVVTQDPTEWWQKALKVMASTLGNQQTRETLRYFTVTCSSTCLIPVDKQGKPLYAALMVSDKRAGAESIYIEGQKEFKEVYTSLGLKCDPSLMLPKILWLKNHEPEVFKKTHQFLTPNDYFFARLTGAFVTDELNALKYHYDPRTKQYPLKLLTTLNIPIDTLPKVVGPGETIGTLSPEIFPQFNLQHNLEAVTSTYDAICAFIGSGPKYREACDVSGTVTSIRTFSPEPVYDLRCRVLTTSIDRFNQHIVGGSNNLGGGLIEWTKQCFYTEDKNPYETMEKDASLSPPGANGLIFLPYLMGERAPLWDPLARAVFFGLDRTHTRKDFTRAVFESCGYCTKNMIEVMAEHKLPVDKIRLSGGLTKIGLVSQIKADVTGKEVLITEELESTALGAAALVWLGKGIYSSLDEFSDGCIKVRTVIIPNEKNHRIYQNTYELFKNVYNSLQISFKKRAEMLDQVYAKRFETIGNL